MGAWSDGFKPLRALRSMRLDVHRAASGGDSRMWSMRIPWFLGKASWR